MMLGDECGIRIEGGGKYASKTNATTCFATNGTLQQFVPAVSGVYYEEITN